MKSCIHSIKSLISYCKTAFFAPGGSQRPTATHSGGSTGVASCRNVSKFESKFELTKKNPVD